MPCQALRRAIYSYIAILGILTGAPLFKKSMFWLFFWIFLDFSKNRFFGLFGGSGDAGTVPDRSGMQKYPWGLIFSSGARFWKKTENSENLFYEKVPHGLPMGSPWAPMESPWIKSQKSKVKSQKSKVKKPKVKSQTSKAKSQKSKGPHGPP